MRYEVGTVESMSMAQLGSEIQAFIDKKRPTVAHVEVDRIEFSTIGGPGIHEAKHFYAIVVLRVRS